MNAVFYYLTWPFKHLRVMFFLVIIGFIFYGVIQCNNTGPKIAETPDYLKNTPNTKYYVNTDSRIYYMDDYVDEGGIVTLLNFYEYNGKKWVFQEFNLPLVKAHFIEVCVHEN